MPTGVEQAGEMLIYHPLSDGIDANLTWYRLRRVRLIVTSMTDRNHPTLPYSRDPVQKTFSFFHLLVHQ